jgi:CubicO group peptidase (beta-lactamase class C family)
MMNTWMVLPRHLEERMAVGHNAEMQKFPYWHFTDAMAGAGAFLSDAGDLLSFVEAAIAPRRTGLGPAFDAMLKVRHRVNDQGQGQAIGWSAYAQEGSEIVLKDGGTYGFAGVIAFDPKRRAGIVVLSNSSVPVVDLAQQIFVSGSTR